MKASVVVPVYNERANLPQLLDEIEGVFRTELPDYHPYEVLFVEDGSTDGTAEWVDEQSRDREHVSAIHLTRSWGQSAALAAGFDHATGEIVIAMDGDLQNDPHDIPALLAKLEEGYDCVSGRRMDRDDPLSKTIPSAIQTRLAKLTGPDINDFGCTLKAYRREALQCIDLRGETHRYIPAQLYDNGFSVTEVAVNHRPREHGESRYGLGRLLRGFSDLLFQLIWVRYSTRMFHLFGGGGLLVMASGFGVGLFLLLFNYLGETSLMAQLPSLILSVGMVLFGLITVMFGVTLEFLTKLYYRDETEYRVAEIVQ